jgi:hypothetical protein
VWTLLRRRLVSLPRLLRAALAILAGLALGAAAGLLVGPSLLHDSADPARPKSDAGAELPRGGESILPEHRVVAFYGAPQADQLGVLGIGSPRREARKLRRFARRYRRPGRPVLPAFELIATIVQASPGKDGRYRYRQTPSLIRRYLRIARANRYLLLLDLQPGRSTFIQEARALEPFLREPDVGLALDPEWNMGRRGMPGTVIGSVGAGTVNQVSEYLAGLVREGGLPQKLLVIHQFTPHMVRSKAKLEAHPELDMVLNSDGFGGFADKRAKYRELAPRTARFDRGFKLFFQEDAGLMSPRQVLRLRPAPVDLVIYE